MNQPSITVQAPAARQTRLPALEPGDRLTRWEFEQRYAAVTLPPDAAGVICSTIFSGLYLATSALVQDDMLRALTIVQQGLATDLHTRFCADLDRRSAKAGKAGNP